MCNFIGKSNEWIFCKLSKSEILRLYSIVHVAMETTKMSNFTCQSKSFISIFFICQVSACELRAFSCYNLANDLYSQTAKTVFSHLNGLKAATSLVVTLEWSYKWDPITRTAKKKHFHRETAINHEYCRFVGVVGWVALFCGLNASVSTAYVLGARNH